MNKLTLPTYEQLFGINKLDFIYRTGTRAAITDFYLLLGGLYFGSSFTDNTKSLKNRSGYYWLNNDIKSGYTLAVRDYGSYYNELFYYRTCGIRLILPFIPKTNITKKKKIDGNIEIEYGYYPQYAAPEEIQIHLEKLYKENKIQKTGNTYTTDSNSIHEYNSIFIPNIHEEYEYNSKKYIRVIAKPTPMNNRILLSNKKIYYEGDVVWIEVEPVKWLVDENKNIILTENILLSGIQFNFNTKTNYITSNFYKSHIYWFINNYLLKELLQNRNINTNHKTTEQLLYEIKTLRFEQEEALNRNKELERKNNSYKQKTKRIESGTKE